jgi:putative cardiolipin synthase
VKATLVSDDPAKGLGKAGSKGRLADCLLEVLESPSQEIGLVTPYFVPTAAGVEELAKLARSGIAVSILTNSYAANNQASVHAGYAPRRRALLEAGVRLFEVRPDAARPQPSRRRGFRLAERGRLSGSPGSLRSSGSALHAKTFAIDRRRLFIGSFNFDPRSLDLNTELGVVFDCAPLAEELMAQFDAGFGDAAWEVVLRRGRLVWLEETDGETRALVREPGMGWKGRAGVAVLSRLPIEWLL